SPAGASHSSSSSSSSPPAAHSLDQGAIESEVSRRVAAELARRGISGGGGGGAGSHEQQQQLADLSDALQRKESEAMRLREELERLRRQAASSPSGDLESLTQSLKSKDEYVHNLSLQNANL